MQAKALASSFANSQFNYSGTFLKWTSSKADTSLRQTKNLVPDEFLRNPL